MGGRLSCAAVVVLLMAILKIKILTHPQTLPPGLTPPHPIPPVPAIPNSRLLNKIIPKVHNTKHPQTQPLLKQSNILIPEQNIMERTQYQKTELYC